MLLRVDETRVVNLGLFSEMNLLESPSGGMHSIRWWCIKGSPLDLYVCKDRAAALKIFDTVARAWSDGKGILDWAELTKTLYKRVALPVPWHHVELMARDLEPRFTVRGTPSGYGNRSVQKMLTAGEMRELIVSMQQADSWPPNRDLIWMPYREFGEEDDDCTAGERAELIRTLQAALAS